MSRNRAIAMQVDPALARGPKVLPRTYAGLISMHAPRVIRSVAAANVVAAVLARMGGRELNADQIDYAALLTKLHAEWQREHGPKRPALAPADLVRGVMEEQELSQGEMAKSIEMTQSNLSAFLNGKRGMPKEAIRRFCETYAISPAAMLGVASASADD